MAAKIPRMSPEEKELLSRLYADYHLRLYQYVRTHIKDDNAASDIVSDVFALACENLGDLKNHPNQLGWLYIVARNKMREFCRKLKSRELSFEEVEEKDKSSINSSYELKELETILQDALTPAEHKRFLRYFIWGYSLQQMADLEGISKTNMSARLSRLRSKIKDILV